MSYIGPDGLIVMRYLGRDETKVMSYIGQVGTKFVRYLGWDETKVMR